MKYIIFIDSILSIFAALGLSFPGKGKHFASNSVSDNHSWTNIVAAKNVCVRADSFTKVAVQLLITKILTPTILHIFDLMFK